jgi:hypothetical protein
MMRALKGVRLGLTAFAIAASPAIVSAQSGSFGGTGYSDYNAAFGFGNGYIWHTGDYWQQIATGTGLTTVSSLGLDLSLHNVLASGYSQTFAVILNGSSVGSFNIASGVSSYANVFTFGAVAGVGTDYTIRLQQTSATIPDGRGSSKLLLQAEASTYALDGAGTVVPEPASVLLLATGLAGIGGVAIRRRKRTA